jgi:hypothetical protein
VGEGTFGKVKLGKHELTGEKVNNLEHIRIEYYYCICLINLNFYSIILGSCQNIRKR